GSRGRVRRGRLERLRAVARALQRRAHLHAARVAGRGGVTVTSLLLAAALIAAPRITNIDGDSVAIWVETDSNASVSVAIVGGATQIVSTTSTTHWTGSTTFTGLSASTSYTYNVTVSSVTSGPYTFQTMPADGSPGVFDLIFTADPHESAVDDQPTEEWYYAHGP